MSGSIRNVAIIPARKGSKRVKGKNRLSIGGYTLLERTAAAIDGSGIIHKSILSTDDLVLIKSAEKYPSIECAVRPAELSADKTSSTDVLRYLIDNMRLGDSRIILLQMTSPFRTGEDIKKLHALMRESNKRSGVSVCRWRTPPSPPFGRTDNPTRLGQEAVSYSSMNSAPEDHAWAINGALYIFDAAEFLATGQLYNADSAIHVMETWRSVDIDYDDDVRIAEALARQYRI